MFNFVLIFRVSGRLEAELHFLLRCDIYNNMRTTFYHKIREILNINETEGFYFLNNMSHLFGNYVKDVLIKRDKKKLQTKRYVI